MPAGNNTQYVTSQGCSVYGLSINCPVTAADGWYYDGNYGSSYYISNQLVTSIDTAPCVTAPPPPPPPASYDYYDYEVCTGPKQYSGIYVTIQIPSGNTAPNSITYNSQCWAKYAGPYTTPSYTPVSYSGANCGCA